MSGRRIFSPRGFLSLIGFLSLLASLGVIAGFFVFVHKVNGASPSTSRPTANGIVVLTGQGDDRINAAADLLSQNAGERLLISGVNPDVTTETLQDVIDLSPAQFSCCVDLGYDAKDTIGNAVETANWVEALGYDSIILVTSDYHMPRARAELAKVMGGVDIIPYPVRLQTPAPKWWKDSDRRRVLLREYAKLLLSFTRRPGARPDTSIGPVSAPPSQEGS